MNTISRWELYTTTNKESNAQKIISTFLNENSFLEVQDTPTYQFYEKTNVIKVILFCKHNASSWKNLAFDLIESAQQVSFNIYMNGNINDNVDLILNKITGANGGISQIFISCANPILDRNASMHA